MALRRSSRELRAPTVAAAMRLFADQGYPGTSVAQVAEAVGISKQLLLYHFRSKAEIRELVVHDVLDVARAFGERLEAIAQSDAPEAETTAALADLAAAHARQPEFVRFVLRELLTPDSDLEARMHSVVDASLAAASARLGTADADADVMRGRLELALLQLLAVHALPDRATDDDDALRDRQRREGQLVPMVSRAVFG